MIDSLEYGARNYVLAKVASALVKRGERDRAAQMLGRMPMKLQTELSARAARLAAGMSKLAQASQADGHINELVDAFEERRFDKVAEMDRRFGLDAEYGKRLTDPAALSIAEHLKIALGLR